MTGRQIWPRRGGGGEGLRGAADLAEQSRRRSTGAADLAEERRRRSESGGSSRREAEEVRVVADLRRRGGVEVGVERIWRGAGEAEDGSREEMRRRPDGRPGWEWRGLGLPHPALPLPLIYGRPARAGGLRGLRARGPAHVPEARPRHGTTFVPGRATYRAKFSSSPPGPLRSTPYYAFRIRGPAQARPVRPRRVPGPAHPRSTSPRACPTKPLPTPHVSRLHVATTNQHVGPRAYGPTCQCLPHLPTRLPEARIRPPRRNGVSLPLPRETAVNPGLGTAVKLTPIGLGLPDG
ncbi:hypothetical protein PVAP13_3NG176882 [Panicum virgatum]|uniref:Uncharacterized protein n=1 Tax=Panicum virgatum TaxID=38727 RepID=A0A8T0U752_PANVG|nr:hypothetical protein PVAP13_3NG176882 [Panicum virgatum]